MALTAGSGRFSWTIIVNNTEPVIVAVTDTGVDVAHPDFPNELDVHPDLEDNLYMDTVTDTLIGWNLIDENKLPLDDCGHGTHVAGIVGAVTNNNLGIASLAGAENYNIKIMPVKILNSVGGGVFDICFEGVRLAADPDDNPETIDGAHIINMSWGGPFFNMEGYEPHPQSYWDDLIADIEVVLSYAADTCHCLLIASASNEGTDETEHDWYPARSEYVLCVAATDNTDIKADYSTFADWVDISAPGGEWHYDHDENSFLSCAPQHYKYTLCDTTNQIGYGYWIDHEYDFMSGTSMSAPLVSSLAAMIKAAFPGNSNDEIRGRILGTADDICSENWNYIGKLGSGRINAFRALTEDEHPNICFHNVTIDDEDDGIFECGETAEIIIELKNWWMEAQNVTGVLATDDSSIIISDNLSSWGNIGNEEIETNSNDAFLITDNSISPRFVDFSLNLEADNMQPKETKFRIRIAPNTNIPLVDIELGENEEITTELVTTDIDNDNVSDIIVGASNGNVYIYNHPEPLIILSTGHPINCTPAVADLSDDGFKEIVVGNNEGEISVWDKEGNMIYLYNDIIGECKNSIVLEDVTGDGRMEVIFTTLESSNCYLYVIEPLEENICFYSTGTSILDLFLTPISVSDVNQDGIKEILMPIKKNGENFKLKVFSVNTSFELVEHWSFSFGDSNTLPITGPIVADIDENLSKKIIMFFYHLNQDYNSLIAINFGEEIPLWENNSIPKTNNYLKDQILVSDIIKTNDGLEILLQNHTEVMLFDCLGQQIEDFQIEDNSPILSKCISDIDNDNVQEIQLIESNSFFVTDNYGNEILEWRTSDFFKGISIANITNDSKEIVLITSDGRIFDFPFNYSNKSITEWSQYQNNARNTGSYYQPIPEIVEEEITVSHDVIIDEKITVAAESRISLNFGPDVEVRFEYGKGINVYGGLNSIGNAHNKTIFSGLCSHKTVNYWDGIKFQKRSDSTIENTLIINAESGLTYNDCYGHVLNKNEIKFNRTGIEFYNSSFCINENEIENNSHGVNCYNYASPFFGLAIPLYFPDNGHNGLINNEMGLFLDSSYPSLKYGHNAFQGNIDYNMQLQNIAYPPVGAIENWWGTIIQHDIELSIDPYEWVSFVPYDSENYTNFSRTDSLSLYEQAFLAYKEGSYLQAIGFFKQFINDTEETIDDLTSLAVLHDCYLETDNIGAFKTFLQQKITEQPSETITKACNHYLALSNRSLDNFDEPIEYYENIILNDPTYEDSCYAVIDIGNTYLEAGGRANGRLAYLVPDSWESHQKTTELLLESIRTGNHIEAENPEYDVFRLYNNFPNPFSLSGDNHSAGTTFSFSIPTDNKVDFSIYNIKGQKVKTLTNQKFEKGFHELTWNGRDSFDKEVYSGVYLYKLDIGGKTKAVKKCLLVK